LEGGRWTVDQFKHPLMVMVDGGWWMVICEKFTLNLAKPIFCQNILNI
jgi:hypothetical protein